MILPASCLHISLSGTQGPKVTEIGITEGDGYDVRISCVHRVLMLCSSTLLKGVPLLPVVSLEALLQKAGRTKHVVQVSHCEHVRLYTEHMPMII
jgi:hypothetical protein